jgi:ribosome-associated protein
VTPQREATGRAPGAAAAMAPADLAERIAVIASDRKAIDVRVLDLRGIVSYTDFFVICSGNTERQTRAIHEAIYRELKDADGLLPRRVEGDGEARWILLDYLDCVAHVFTPDARDYYRLEQLWGEAPARAVG